MLPKGATVEKLAGGLQFIEGPIWIDADGGYLVFSDIPANELKRWDRANGVRTFRAPSGNANGNTLDREGRLLSAEHSGRISRTEKDGTVATVVDAFDGAKLSSPNDVVVKRDGTIWFTDPTYGIKPRKQETPGNYVYRFDPATSRLTRGRPRRRDAERFVLLERRTHAVRRRLRQAAPHPRVRRGRGGRARRGPGLRRHRQGRAGRHQVR